MAVALGCEAYKRSKSMPRRVVALGCEAYIRSKSMPHRVVPLGCEAYIRSKSMPRRCPLLTGATMHCVVHNTAGTMVQHPWIRTAVMHTLVRGGHNAETPTTARSRKHGARCRRCSLCSGLCLEVRRANHAPNNELSRTTLLAAAHGFPVVIWLSNLD
jgi:hypothetical protein